MPKIVDDEKVFRAVMEMVASRGYSGAATSQIAAAAGVSEVTLFRKFGTKAGLVQRAIHALIDAGEFEARARYTGDIQADLLRVLHAYRNTVVLHGGFFFALFSEIHRTPELAETIERPLQLFQSIGQLLARYQAEGVLQTENPLHAVAALLGPLIYLSVIRQSGAGLSLPPMDLEQHVRLFLEGRCRGRDRSRQVAGDDGC